MPLASAGRRAGQAGSLWTREQDAPLYTLMVVPDRGSKTDPAGDWTRPVSRRTAGSERGNTWDGVTPADLWNQPQWGAGGPWGCGGPYRRPSEHRARQGGPKPRGQAAHSPDGQLSRGGAGEEQVREMEVTAGTGAVGRSPLGEEAGRDLELSTVP